MDRYYLRDNHKGEHVYAKCYCGHRWEETVSKKMQASCPSCDGTMRINYSFREYQDSKPFNYDGYGWVQVYWRCTHWQLGYIYEDGRPSIGFACVDEDQDEPPAGANIIADLTDKALNELKVEFYKTMKE